MIYPLLTVEKVITQRRTRSGNLTRTRQGKSVLKLAGECIEAGGKVMLNYYEDGMGQEWVTGSLDWRPDAKTTGH